MLKFWNKKKPVDPPAVEVVPEVDEPQAEPVTPPAKGPSLGDKARKVAQNVGEAAPKVAGTVVDKTRKAAHDVGEKAPEVAGAVAQTTKKVAGTVASKTEEAVAYGKLKLKLHNQKGQLDKALAELGGRTYELLKEQSDVYGDDAVQAGMEKVRVVEEAIAQTEAELKGLGERDA